MEQKWHSAYSQDEEVGMKRCASDEGELSCHRQAADPHGAEE